MDMKLIPVAVTDVDRAKGFHGDQVGFSTGLVDTASDDLRLLPLTPPGSQPGLQVVVDDAAAVPHEHSRGVDVGEVDEQPPGRLVYWNDPDGNSGAAQQMLPDQ